MKAILTLASLLDAIKKRFVGKDEIIDVLGLALVARENAFLYGPPGTAKSAIVRSLASGITGGAGAFEYLLTRFTEPSELFGPFDIRRLREGDLVTNTSGMLPEATTVFLDEVFNANSAILNSLLLALNERRFRRGQETRELPAVLFAGASNQLPTDEALEALYDRFLLRVRCDAVSPPQLMEVLNAGRRLENNDQDELPTVSAEELRTLQKACRSVDLSATTEAYLTLIASVRNLGISLSDRRAVKIQNLIAASALLAGREIANTSDLWVMKYVWDSDEQIAPLAALIDAALVDDASPQPHPRAHKTAVDAEELAAELARIREQWDDADARQKTSLKDEMRHLNDRIAWLPNNTGRDQLTTDTETMWQQILASS
ncbi:MAG: AAA family ATPase [Saprospiraceae bacterium]